jgi:P-type conjugative transfer protein VirB9
MRVELSLSLALALCSSVAFAIDVPQGSKFDSRIQYVDYNPGDVVVVRAVPGLGARIVFGPGESILDVASGFTQGWEFADRRNILYVKPKSIKGENQQPSMSPEAGKWDTNLMVTTNVRMYDFDLRLLPGSNRGRAPSDQRIAYRVEFRYPADDAAKAKLAAEKQRAQAKLDAKPAPRNWNYSMQVGKKSESIVPTMAYDDGRFTYLQFPNNRDFPTVFIVAPDKSESIVNTTVEKDVLVIHRVSPELVLRLGNAVVGIYNDSFDLDGVPPTNGTTVPGVKRVIISGEKSNHEQ